MADKGIKREYKRNKNHKLFLFKFVFFNITPKLNASGPLCKTIAKNVMKPRVGDFVRVAEIDMPEAIVCKDKPIKAAIPIL